MARVLAAAGNNAQSQTIDAITLQRVISKIGCSITHALTAGPARTIDARVVFGPNWCNIDHRLIAYYDFLRITYDIRIVDDAFLATPISPLRPGPDISHSIGRIR